MNAPRFALGLVVGKLAPLHLGHEWLIAQAAARCDRVLVLSYAKPSPEGCDVERRRAWLSARFPDRAKFEWLVLDAAAVAAACRARGIEARDMPRDDVPDDAVHQAWLAWLLFEVLGRRPSAMFGSEAYVPGCASTLGRAFGTHVEAVMGDPGRVQVPVRATDIRRDPVAGRRFLSPEVAASFVRRVALLGGESTGKTSLARALAERLGTSWVPEYGRERWEAQGGRLVEADLLAIGQEQVRREEAAMARANGWLVCDTTPLTTFGYAHWMFGRADPRLEALSRRTYDRFVLCSPDFEFVQDGTRREPGFRDAQQRWYQEQLSTRPAVWMEAGGSVESRVEAIVRWLST
jgi:HTH-type transcriptional repressor of NAD biosynthesis genes